ncbi:MAG: Lrp/AsnC family transcriptional regulator [Chitinophagaceae bacterium]|nr:Lrp/AsnC family transcriptional regulator [Chitinophagaceae bacterium]
MLTSLDRDDLQILQLLQHDARLTTKEIADKIGKSVSPVYERIRRLQSDGVIQQYVAVLDKRKIGKSLTAYTHVQLKEHADHMMKTFEQEVIKIPEVMECYHMTGQYDYLLKVAMGDMDEYYGFIIDKIARLPNVGTVQSFFVLFEAKKETAYRINIPEENGRRKSEKSKLTMNL